MNRQTFQVNGRAYIRYNDPGLSEKYGEKLEQRAIPRIARLTNFQLLKKIIKIGCRRKSLFFWLLEKEIWDEFKRRDICL
jgi:hypothetical protein